MHLWGDVMKSPKALECIKVTPFLKISPLQQSEASGPSDGRRRLGRSAEYLELQGTGGVQESQESRDGARRQGSFSSTRKGPFCPSIPHPPSKVLATHDTAEPQR